MKNKSNKILIPIVDTLQIFCRDSYNYLDEKLKIGEMYMILSYDDRFVEISPLKDDGSLHERSSMTIKKDSLSLGFLMIDSMDADASSLD